MSTAPKTSAARPTMTKSRQRNSEACLGFAAASSAAAASASACRLSLSCRNDEIIYQMNRPTKMPPSTRLRPSSPMPKSVCLRPQRISSAVMAILTGMSRRRLLRVIATGAMIAERPRMRAVLNTFEPMMLPTARSEFFSMADTKLTTISGAEVPSATMVRPITNSLIPHRRASPDAPSTSASAPISTSARPANSNKISIVIKKRAFRFAPRSYKNVWNSKLSILPSIPLQCTQLSVSWLQKVIPLVSRGITSHNQLIFRCVHCSAR